MAKNPGEKTFIVIENQQSACVARLWHILCLRGVNSLQIKLIFEP